MEIEAFGPLEALETFSEPLRTEEPPAASIREIQSRAIPGKAVSEFVIVPSEGKAGAESVSIPPDLATCSECERELFNFWDPAVPRSR